MGVDYVAKRQALAQQIQAEGASDVGAKAPDQTLKQQGDVPVPHILATDKKVMKGEKELPEIDKSLFTWEMLEIIKDEGFELEPYKDSRGFITGGIGHKFTRQDFQDWNPGWSTEEKYDFWISKFKEDYANASKASAQIMKKWGIPYSEAHDYVIKNMVFNMGPTKVGGGVLKDGKKIDGFKGFLTDLSQGNIEGAILEMKRKSKDSEEPNPWYTQARARVDKLAAILKG